VRPGGSGQEKKLIFAFIIALISIPITATLAIILPSPLFHGIEHRLQWQNRSVEEWESMGIMCPGGRLPAVAFFFGAIDTTIGKAVSLLVAAMVFSFVKQTMPILFVAVAGLLLLLHDLSRVLAFRGDPWVWKEAGFMAGDVVGVTTGTILAILWIA
jgi:hypothetical protein